MSLEYICTCLLALIYAHLYVTITFCLYKYASKNEIPVLDIYIHNSAIVNQLYCSKKFLVEILFSYYRSQTSIKTKDDVICRFNRHL